jgi:hypothetical protein
MNTATEQEIENLFDSIEPCDVYLLKGCAGFADFHVVSHPCKCGFCQGGADELLCTPCVERFNRPGGETTCGLCNAHLGTVTPLRR